MNKKGMRWPLNAMFIITLLSSFTMNSLSLSRCKCPNYTHCGGPWTQELLLCGHNLSLI